MDKGRLSIKGILAFVIISLSFFLTGLSYSLTPPDITYIGTISSQPFPGRVSSDGYGDIYIGDTEQKVIKIFNHRGIYEGAINLPSKLLSLAISPDNLIYVGLINGEIDIYSRNGIFSGKITGLTKPLSMAFSEDSRLYVIDGYFVKVFDATHNLINTFGGYGMDNGRFISPVSIAIYGSELYILDTMGTYATEGSYTNTPVWEVNVFDLNGNFIRSFSNYGYAIEGKLGSATSLAIDSEGRFYISDFIQGIIVIYDGYGSYLMTKPVTSPLNIYIKNNRLYIASSMAKEVSIYGIDNYPQLEISPYSMSFSYQGGFATPPQVLNIYNTGNAPLTWQIDVKEPWLSVSKTTGELQANSSDTIDISVNPGNMAPGDYSGTIEILSNGGSEILRVTLTVYPSPKLNVEPTSFSVRASRNAAIEPLVTNISIENAINNITWNAVSDSEWLTITPSSGSSETIVSANINVSTNLQPGNYTGNITVTAHGALGSPQVITVNLEITSKGRIKVNTNIDNAEYLITGLVSIEGMGSSIYEADPGTYTIKFRPVEGYKTPPDMADTLNPGEEIVFNGEYKKQSPLNILASHGPGRKDNTEIRVFDSSGSLIRSIPPLNGIMRGATVTVSDIDGDGISEIITGTDPGRYQRINILNKDGSLIERFKAFSINGRVGVEVESGDLNQDGRAEILAGTSRLRGIIKIFENSDNGFIERLRMVLYRGANGIRLTPLDYDNDGIPEIVTVPKRGGGGLLKIIKIDASNWTYEYLGSFSVCQGSGSRELTSGDINNDGTPEIILSCQYDTGTMVEIYSIDGVYIKSFPTGSTIGDYVTAGDLDGDGVIEIIVGDGNSAHKNNIKIFSPDGTLLKSFNAFEDSFGIRVKTGIIE